MNKVDIVIKHIGNDDFYDMNGTPLLNRILAAMDEYAQQQVKNCSIPAVMPSLPIERFDAEDWLGQNKDIWNHPRVTDRNNKESYEVADLMAEFAMSFFRQ